MKSDVEQRGTKEQSSAWKENLSRNSLYQLFTLSVFHHMYYQDRKIYFRNAMLCHNVTINNIKSILWERLQYAYTHADAYSLPRTYPGIAFGGEHAYRQISEIYAKAVCSHHANEGQLHVSVPFHINPVQCLLKEFLLGFVYVSIDLKCRFSKAV